MKTKPLFFLPFIFLSLFFVAFASADTREALAERFAERDEAISALLLNQKVGENNRGFLSPRDELSEEEEKLVEAENEDRLAFYQLVAEQVNRSVEEVGLGRARQLAQRSVPGVWVQTREGEWIIKE